ncbi:S9 family peptidase [Oscillibacter sp.]|jgi:dipeptidyl aminopeptidase/acylaminoacyl peptidase|uniref:alpha/beta hydrolase family protein n=1 Tax=Oscillibacter sp. TaxID=1945593 RepID=UPI002172C4D8|nr:S9 family peptidase [Oscillibacter sp.]MCI9648225.1 S9 family peptidase [Oscillibacter sp.]
METVDLRDFLNYRYPSALELSPDGKRLVFAVKSVDPIADGYRWELWLCELNSGRCAPLRGGNGLRRSVWMDNRHLLLWERTADPDLLERGIEAVWTTLFRLDVESGEKRALHRIPLAVTSVWPMEGGRCLLLAETRLDEPNLLTLTGEAREQEIARRLHTKGYQALTELPLCEDGVGICNRVRGSLFLLESDGGFRPVTPPHWDVNRVNVSGSEALFTAFPFRDVKPVAEGVYRWSSDSGEIKNLIAPDQYSVDYVGFFGDQALCLGLVMRDYGVYEHPTFFLTDGERTEDLGRYDRRVNSEVVTDCFDGRVTGQRMVDRDLYFLNTDGVGVQLCRWTRETGVAPIMSSDDYLIDFDTRDGKSFVFSAAVGLDLPEVYLWQGGEMRRLSHLNSEALKGRTLSVPERFSFYDRDGVEIDGFVLKPVDYHPGKTYPGVLHVHGGPKMVFGPGFHHEMQLWAARGYFVCYCNPRGSCGKGNAFADLQGKYGTVDFNDLMDFTDEAIRRYPDLDAGRIGVCGGSYGGFMTNWIIGHTDRFRCAVSQRSIANYVGDYLLSDIGYYYVPDQQLGTVWDHPERLWQASPLTYADRVKTPTLFIHSDRDYRCTLANGLEMFAALKLHGVESRLCMFYGESHGLSRTGKPSNRICRLEEILNWLDRHLKEGNPHESA